MRTSAAKKAVAHLTAMVGRPSDEKYRKTIVRMLHSNALPHDMVGAVLIGVEIAIDVLRDKIAEEETNVKRID